MNQFTLSLSKWLDTTRTLSMQTLFMTAKKLDVSMSQLKALLHIHKIGRGNVSYIGSFLGITNAAASQLLDKLVDIGFVNRSEDPDDRRKKILVLSEKGNAIIQDAFSTQEDWIKRLADSFNPDEQKQIDLALKLILDKAEKLNFNSVD